VAFAAAAAGGAAGQPRGEIDTSAARVSVVVPALNESKVIEETLRMLQALSPPAHEIIVVDGGSTDGTSALARSAGGRSTRVLAAGRGRPVQMNAGAAAATGDILVFVHGACLPSRCRAWRPV
jgi:glycosyltransferase involved in cell wall biosynthesis